MYGNGPPAISAPGRDSKASPTRSIPRSSSAPSTRFCAGVRGPPARGRFETPSGTGITLSAGRSSAASGAPKMPRTSSPVVRAPLRADGGPANLRMLAEVAEGLSAPQKELSPKYFYDQRGSELSEA